MAQDREKIRRRKRKWDLEHRESERIRILAWRKNNPEKSKESGRKSRLKRQYKITDDEYQSMMKIQKERCAICGTKSEHLCIDHEHASGKVRGLLCKKCNSGLGFFGDSLENLERAIKYLRDMV